LNTQLRNYKIRTINETLKSLIKGENIEIT
jgi:hypothetical protein